MRTCHFHIILHFNQRLRFGQNTRNIVQKRLRHLQFLLCCNVSVRHIVILLLSLGVVESVIQFSLLILFRLGTLPQIFNLSWYLRSWLNTLILNNHYVLFLLLLFILSNKIIYLWLLIVCHRQCSLLLVQFLFLTQLLCDLFLLF